MKKFLIGLVFCAGAAATPTGAGEAGDFVIVVHGGAGTIQRDAMTPEREAEYRDALALALETGGAVLEAGGSSLDAVTAAVRVLEDEPLFNAGRGAVFTSDGRNELDAAIMDGRTRNAGAVAGVTRIRNPVELARAVMERSRHVMMAGEGAENFAAEEGFEFVDPSWFHTDHRWEQLERARAAERDAAAAADLPREFLYGTVGAVALDLDGNLAAATSTGGMTNKRWGRVGDVPVIGAGTYADNRATAISATGHGEYFIRTVAAHEIAARVRLAGATLDEASRAVLDEIAALGGDGGVIAITPGGDVTMEFNSQGMYRGYLTGAGEIYTAIFSD